MVQSEKNCNIAEEDIMLQDSDTDDEGMDSSETLLGKQSSMKDNHVKDGTSGT